MDVLYLLTILFIGLILLYILSLRRREAVVVKVMPRPEAEEGKKIRWPDRVLEKFAGEEQRFKGGQFD